jgi:hypothetical protein
MSDAFDDLIDRQSPPNDPARIAAVIASDQRFAYLATSAFAIRLPRLDQKIIGGVPMSLKRLANVLGTTPCCSRNSATGFRGMATRR